MIAASTLSICWAFWRIALLPSAAWVTTPADRVATSGTRVASALAEMFSSVPSAAAAIDGDDGSAWAVIEAPRARDRASSSGVAVRRMGSPSCGGEGGVVAMNAL
ncbi:hypothetical protein D3C73_1226380 [compost metagenome]